MAQQQGPGVPSAAGQPQAGDKEKEARTWGMICHLAALAMCIPFGNIIGPLVVWMIKKDEFPFVNDQGKEALNFQISMTMCGIAAVLVCVVLSFVCIGSFLMPLVGLAWLVVELVMIIRAAMAANKGEAFRYPLAIRFLK